MRINVQVVFTWMFVVSMPQELTAERVKKLIEVVMRVHLGWLVVWGNIFGGVIGLLSELVGYSENTPS